MIPGFNLSIYASSRCQIKPHSSQWFSGACTAAVTYRNHFFGLYQQSKSSTSEVSSDLQVIIAKGFLKLPNLIMLVKQKRLSPSRNLALATSVELQIVFPTKVSLLYLLCLMNLRCCLVVLMKQISLEKKILRTEILTTQTSLYQFFFLGLK